MLYNWTVVNETCQGVYVIQLDSGQRDVSRCVCYTVGQRSMRRVKVCLLYSGTAVNETFLGVYVIQLDNGQ